MTHTEPPHFPRGFLLADRPISPPPTFIQGPLLPNFYVHPWTPVQAAGGRDLFVVVIGSCVHTLREQGEPAPNTLIEALRSSEDHFFDVLNNYSGRHAVIFGNFSDYRVVNDATGMRAIFYSVEGGVVASHAQLVEKTHDGGASRSDLPFRYGYPGNRTPYSRVRILTPNTEYRMNQNCVSRFWPVLPPAPKTSEEAAVYLLNAATVAFREMSSGRNVRLTLTAGLDSRALLAIALHSGVHFHTYTYGNDSSSKVDRQVAASLAAKYALDHTVISHPIEDSVLEERLRESHYAFHHAQWVGALREYFTSHTDIAVIGNLLEIGRSNYLPARAKGVTPPLTANAMVGLHHRKFGSTVFKLIREYGQDRFRRDAREAFQGFIEDSEYEQVSGVLDPFDQFYWEHRMATWQGVAMGERDFYAEPFVPFNARSIFTHMLGVPVDERQRDVTVQQMINLVDPTLLDIPINPRTWQEP